MNCISHNTCLGRNFLTCVFISIINIHEAFTSASHKCHLHKHSTLQTRWADLSAVTSFLILVRIKCFWEMIFSCHNHGNLHFLLKIASPGKSFSFFVTICCQIKIHETFCCITEACYFVGLLFIYWCNVSTHGARSGKHLTFFRMQKKCRKNWNSSE